MLHMTPSIAARISRHTLLLFMQMSVTSMASVPSPVPLKLSSLLGVSLRAEPPHPFPLLSGFTVTNIKNLRAVSGHNPYKADVSYVALLIIFDDCAPTVTH